MLPVQIYFGGGRFSLRSLVKIGRKQSLHLNSASPMLFDEGGSNQTFLSVGTLWNDEVACHFRKMVRKLFSRPTENSKMSPYQKWCIYDGAIKN